MTKTSLAELREEMRSVARGERKPAALPIGTLLQTLSSPDNMELLRLIHTARPATVTELVEMTGRAQPNVSRALQKLARHGLIRMVREGQGVRPVPTMAHIDIDIVRGTYAAIERHAAE